MYKIDNETEALVRSTELCINRRDALPLNFRLHETIAPEVDNKFVAFPAPLQDLTEPKSQYVVRGNDEIDVINQFIDLTRDVKRFQHMFQESSESAGE